MKQNRFPFIYLGFFLFIGICIALVGYQYHKNFEKHFRSNTENQLSIIADLKVTELNHWLEERRGDAETIFGNKYFSTLIKRYLKNPNVRDDEREIKEWMKEFQTGFNYDAVALADLQLVNKIVIPESVKIPQAHISPDNLDSLREGKFVFEDFYKDELMQKVFLNVLIPINDNRQLIGIIELRIDPKTYLYPILSSWPMPSETSETLLLRHEGNDAIYLNELRFQKNSALNLRVSLMQANVTTGKSAFWQKGIIEGTGYRGQKVVAHYGKVPNSPWYLVAQTDTSEVYAPLRKELLQTGIFTFVFILLVGLCLVFIWRYQRNLVLLQIVKSAEALRENEERFRMLFDKAPLSYQSLDINANFLDVNKTWLETFGYNREEVIGKWFGDFLAPEYVDSFRERFQIYKASGKSHAEFEMVNQDGTTRFISFEGRVAKDTEGNFKQTHGILMDISDQKRLELEQQVLFEITEGVATTVNLNELLQLIHRSLGKVLYADNFFVALYDKYTELFSFPYWADKFDPLPEPEAMSKSCSSYVFRTGHSLLLTPEIFEQLKEKDEVELVGSPSPSWVGIPLHTPNRSIGVFVLQHYEKDNVYSESDVQFLDSVGSQIAMVIDRKKAEEDLRESEIKLNAILQSTADGILAIDRNGRIIKTNMRFADLWQIPQALIDINDDTALIRFVLDQLTNPDEFISKIQQLYHSTDKDLDLLHFKDGRTFERYSAPMVMDDSSIGRVWSFRDISERKRAEDEILLKNEELQKLNAEKDKFFSIIAHDLRTPFNGFLGLTEILTEDLHRLTMVQVQNFAKSMKDSATNLYGLLENLLEWSQVQQGAFPFSPKSIPLRPMVIECLAILLEPAKNKGIEISYDISDNMEVFADSNMLQTVIRNLVSNAVKFTHKGGTVNISAKATSDSVELCIQDSGMGMSPVMVDNLFRIDVHTNRKGTEGEPSTGLGLLLCKEFIEKNGGKIWVESEEGVGSTFFFNVPFPTSTVGS